MIREKEKEIRLEIRYVKQSECRPLGWHSLYQIGMCVKAAVSSYVNVYIRGGTELTAYTASVLNYSFLGLMTSLWLWVDNFTAKA